MLDDDPVTLWIDELRGGEEAAAGKLWNHFVGRLYESARSKLRPATRRVYDEEDAALSAFRSVCAGISAGRFPGLEDRRSLLRLMLAITARKVAHRHRYDLQQRRDVRRNLSELIFVTSTDDSAAMGIDQLPAREPTPEFVMEFVETCERLFQSLDDPLQEVVRMRMEGYTVAEVAQRLDCSQRTVKRRLEVIRRHWGELELSVE